MDAGPKRDDTILLLEDDLALAGEIALAFAKEGVAIVTLTDEDALAIAVRTGAGAALIMDRMIGAHDSLTLLEALRAEGHRVPVVVISSLAGVDDRILGLKAGGDDYLVKPFVMGELIARVGALRRRADDARRTRLVVGPLVVDLLERSVRRGSRAVVLSQREFSLVEYLARHPGQVVTRAMLLEGAWNYRLQAETNVVDVHMGNIRRKIDGEGEPRLITSVRGLGFRLAVPETEPDA